MYFYFYNLSIYNEDQYSPKTHIINIPIKENKLIKLNLLFIRSMTLAGNAKDKLTFSIVNIAQRILLMNYFL